MKDKRNIGEVGGFPPSFPPFPYFKIILSFLLIILATILHHSTQAPTFETQEPTVGSVRIIIDNSVYEYDFNKGDSFVGVLSKHHTVVISRGILFSLDHIETDFRTSYIAIYFNGTYSQFGVLQLPLCNDCSYSFEETKIN